MGMIGSDTQTIASILSGVGVWVGVGVGAEVGVGDGIKVPVGRLVAGTLVGAVVATCWNPIAGWQDASKIARLRKRMFVKDNRTRTSPKEDNHILSSPALSLTRKNTRIQTPSFGMAGASEVY